MALHRCTSTRSVSKLIVVVETLLISQSDTEEVAVASGMLCYFRIPLPSAFQRQVGWSSVNNQDSTRGVAGRVVGTTALSSPVGAHGPFEEFALLPGFAYCRATSQRQGAGSLIFNADIVRKEVFKSLIRKRSVGMFYLKQLLERNHVHFAYSRFAYDLSHFAYSHFTYCRLVYSENFDYSRFAYSSLLIKE